jgi:23S rRNA (uracil1939-C5)-methyltransferase
MPNQLLIRFSYNVSGTTTGEKIHLLSGQDYITDRIGPLILKISPESFFQTNTRMAETLYDVVKKIYPATITSGYLGPVLRRWKHCPLSGGRVPAVIGLEVVRAALADARENARMNNITNAEFINFDLEKQIRTEPSVLQSLPQPER